MAADAGIFQQYLQPVKSVAEYRAGMDAQEQNALQLAASRMQAKLSQRDFEEGEQARQVAKDNANGDYNALSAAFMKAGMPKRAQEVLAAGLKADAERTTITKNKQDIEKGSIDLDEAKRIGSLKRAIAFNGPQDAILDIQTRLKNGELTQEQADQHLSTIPQDQAGFAMWQLDMTKKLLSPEKRVEMVTAKPVSETDGQTKFYRDVNPNSPTYGKVVDGTQVQIQVSPEAKLVDERTRSEGAKNRGVQMRGQDLTDSRARETLASGKIPAGYRMKADGTMEAIPGGPADIKSNAEGAKKVSDAKEVLSILDQVDKLLPSSTGGYIGTGVDSVLGAANVTTKGAETVDKLKVLQGALVSKMPKMSGPQSDKDVLLYREMAGQVGDSTLPVARRQAAAAEVRRLNEKYAGMQEGESKPKSTGIAPKNGKGWALHTDAQGNKAYVSPDGKSFEEVR